MIAAPELAEKYAAFAAIVGARNAIATPSELRTYECDGLSASASGRASSCCRRRRRKSPPSCACAPSTDCRSCRAARARASRAARCRSRAGSSIGTSRMTRHPRDRSRRTAACACSRASSTSTSPSSSRRDGYYYAPDPSSQSVCSIGGNVAENSGGAHCLKYGFTVNHVVGATHRARRRRASSTSAPSGGEADALGLRFDGRASSAAKGCSASSPRSSCASCACRKRRARSSRRSLRPTKPERPCPRSSRRHRAGGDRDDGCSSRSRRSSRRPASIGRSTSVPRSDGRRRRARRGRAHGRRRDRADARDAARSRSARRSDDAERAADVEGPQEPRSPRWAASRRTTHVQDGVIPRKEIAPVLREIAQLGARAGLRVANVFHAGDGNLHPLVLYDARVPGEEAKAERVARRDPARLPPLRRIDHGRARRGPRQGVLSRRAVFTDDDLGHDEVRALRLRSARASSIRTRCFRRRDCAATGPAPYARTRSNSPATAGRG